MQTGAALAGRDQAGSCVPDGLAGRFLAVRGHSDRIAAALSPEDQCVQSMPDASPAKWHRAHTTWFFEQFVLQPNLPGYAVFDPDFSFLFNSYYDAVGARHPRPMRGLLTRPASGQVDAYRRHVDAAMVRLLDADGAELETLVELGLHHEQQHQELLLTDMLHAFSSSMLAPAVLPGWREPVGEAALTRWVEHPGGIVEVGHRGDGVRVRQRGTAASGVVAAACTGQPSGGAAATGSPSSRMAATGPRRCG